MNFLVNTSPFAGREGKFVTTRNIKDRLQRELERNLALRVTPGETADSFIVSGRGALHISILIENMRREGFEFGVGPPKVLPSLHGHAHSMAGLQHVGRSCGDEALVCGVCGAVRCKPLHAVRQWCRQKSL